MTDTAQIKQKNKKVFSGKTGSFCLEIALVFPVLMVILFAFLWQMAAIRSEMVFQSVLLKEAEKASFLGVLKEYLPEESVNDDGKEEMQGFETGEIEFKGDWIGEVFAAVIRIQIQNHYTMMCEENPAFRSLILFHDEYIEASAAEDTVFLTSVYAVYTPFQRLDRKFTIALRLWDQGDGSGKVTEQSGESIWKCDNFTRGKILRRRFGGNLPFGFPVLSGFFDGDALIIESMNLRSSSWQNPQDAGDQMKESVDELARYDGMEEPWGKEGIVIRRKDIRRRNIRFIIPENTDMEHYASVFHEVRAYAARWNVCIEIIPYQKA